MKRIRQSVVISTALAVLSCNAGFGRTCMAQDADEQQIERAILQFFESLSKRDADGMKRVVHTSLTGVEAGRKNAKVEVIDFGRSDDKRAPRINDDWENVTIAEVDAQISSTRPSVAMASFVLRIPLTADEIANLKKNLDDAGPEFDEWAKKRVARAIQDKGWTEQMFAMLAKDRGAWKVVCMTLPS